MLSRCFLCLLKTFCLAVLIVNLKYFNVHVDVCVKYDSCISVLMQALHCGWHDDFCSVTALMRRFQTLVVIHILPVPVGFCCFCLIMRCEFGCQHQCSSVRAGMPKAHNAKWRFGQNTEAVECQPSLKISCKFFRSFCAKLLTDRQINKQ